MPQPTDHTPAVRRWLWFVFALITAMVAIGGITRLTGSGLSMVEWRPLMGTLPPLSEAEWLRVFDQYKLSPQYAKVNHWMTLADFQRIFFWEYLHRLLGRLIGLVTFFPWLYFVLRKRLSGRTARRAFLAIVFGGLQGLLGWFMVKSGLVDRPEVSHYRLAAHLSLAFFVGAYVLWVIADLDPRPSRARVGRRWTWTVGVLLALQIVYGAFMAGTRAGYLFSTFPDMNGVLVPDTWLRLSPAWHNLVENHVAIHFIHRCLAYLVAGAVLALATVGLRRAQAPGDRRAAALLGGLVAVQFGLGVWTVMGGVPIAVATAHQVVAFWLLGALVWFAHAFRGGAEPTAG
ncbi:MAG: COX15/CtaA family protein [Myxococcales bacterium]|nr:COX15/CtaA family protein [Myxococcales bacterium]MCB9525315.1 COX15/CtaA family protein [Myxococcales bacterium]